jgi:hypothetical protein
MKIGAGAPTALPESVESYLVEGIILAAELGWPLNRNDIKNVVSSYCMLMKLSDTFKSGTPGDDWMSAFQGRWKAKLSVRAAETLTKPRAAGLTREVLDMFYERFENKLDELNIKNHRGRIFNLDETGLSTKADSKGLFYKRGVKEAQVLAPNEGKTMFTVLFCCNAGGDFLPPYVVYKGTPGILQTTWLHGAPPGTSFNTTKSGWMEDYVFEAWFKNHFLGWLKTMQVQKPVMLVFDGHGSHLTYAMAHMASENGVTLYCLPPHTSSKLQPLDVGVYGPLKGKWGSILRDYYKESRHTNVSKAGFPSLLTKLYDHIVNRPGNAANAFASCGLCPFNRNAIDDSKLTITTTFDAKPGSASTSGEAAPDTPHKALRCALINVLSPEPSTSTSAALLSANRQRKRVQLKIGECLTEPEALERLQNEEEERAKKKQKTTAKKTGTGKATPNLPMKGVNRAKVAKPRRMILMDTSDDDSSTDNDDSSIDEVLEPIASPISAVDWTKRNIDRYVAAVYDNNWYVALVEKHDEILQDVTLRFMAPPGPNTLFHWPTLADKCMLPTKDILGILNAAPMPTTNRATKFSITEKTMDAIDAKFACYI